MVVRCVSNSENCALARGLVCDQRATCVLGQLNGRGRMIILNGIQILSTRMKLSFAKWHVESVSRDDGRDIK